MSEYLHLKAIGILILALILALIYFAFFGKGRAKIVAWKILFAILFFILCVIVFTNINLFFQNELDLDELLTSALVALVCIYYSIRGYQFLCRKKFGKGETTAIGNMNGSKVEKTGMLMKKHPSKRFIVEAACMILIIVIIVIRINRIPKVEGWTEFRRDALTKFSCVNNVEYGYVGNRFPLYLTFELKREINMDEVDSVYEYTRKYLQSKTIIRDFKEYSLYKAHLYGDGFDSIYIDFFLKGKRGYSISSRLESDNEFHTWIVYYDNEIVEKYESNDKMIE